VDKNADYTNLADLRRERRVENYSKSESANDAPLDHRTDRRALAGRGGLSTELAAINALQSGHIHRAFPMRQRRAEELPVAARCREHRYLHAAHDTAEHDKSDDDNSSGPVWLTPLELLVELDAHRTDSA
jgi:hypothetical protein